ncbi:MAG: radical SAM protein, partial [Oscillospiraceae bacterium]|nr:radical SAM protein [Oscillospiraceae bacterium]
MSKKIKVGFVSLGCSKNRIDTEVMLHTLATAGYQITGDETEADVVIINTCAFIESAKKEAIDNILDIAWLKENKDLKGIVVCGCLAERYGKEILEEIPEVDAIVGVGGLPKIAEAVEAAYNSAFCNKKQTAQNKYCCFDDKNTMPLGGDRVVTTPEYSAYIKVAEGCDNHCTYCVIGNIRGKFRSRPIEDIVAEAKTLEELGVKELNIVAQDTSRYGLDIYG